MVLTGEKLQRNLQDDYAASATTDHELYVNSPQYRKKFMKWKKKNRFSLPVNACYNAIYVRNPVGFFVVQFFYNQSKKFCMQKKNKRVLSSVGKKERSQER